jgi:ABC-type sugar transport system substrate-binding protein
MDQLLNIAVKSGHKSGTVLVGYCCQDSGTVGTLTAGYLTAVKQYNASNGTRFTTSQVLDTSDSDPSAANTTWQTKLQSLQGKNLVAIACSQVGDPVIVAAKALGMKPGFVPIATVNTTQDRLDYLEEGWMDVIIDQSVYAQGYIAAAQAWMYVNSKTSPTPLYDTGAALITKDTVSQARENLAYVATRAKQLGIQA